MKSILFIFALATTNYSFSQGNLQFNNVYTYSGAVNLTPGLVTCSDNISYPYVSQTFTVPAGKIWRIENIYFTGSLFYVNGCRAGDINSYNGNPIWLKGGETLIFTSSTLTRYYSINIVEFNVIP
jgi:hypothetical protein